MGKAQTMERVIAKGQLVPLLFSQGAVADAQAAVAMTVVDGVAKATEYTMPFDYDIVAISITSDTARTGGTLTVDATIDGTATGLQAVINATDTLRKHATQTRNTDGGNAGSRVGVKLTTAGTFAPVTADVIVTVWCIVHLEGI